MGDNRVWVREAEERDIPWILKELREFDEFAGTRYSMYPQEDVILGELLVRLMGDHVFFVALRGEEERLGFIAGALTTHLFNPDLACLQEYFWWVAKKARGSSAGIRLLDAFTRAGEELEVEWTLFTMRHNTPASDRSLLKRGFTLQDRIYLKERRDGHIDRIGIGNFAGSVGSLDGVCGEGKLPGEEEGGEGAGEGDQAAEEDGDGAGGGSSQEQDG